MELSSEVKRTIISRMITEQTQMLYSLEIQGKVAQKIGDTETKKTVMEEMVKAQRRIDAFQAELDEVTD